MTFALKVQQDGPVLGVQDIIGATFAYQAVDDSDGPAHDSDTTYVTLLREDDPGGLPRGRIVFPLFLQAEGLTPVSIAVRAAVRRSGAAAAPDVEIGFWRAGVAAVSASVVVTTTTWQVVTRTFTTSPFTGAAWTEADLIGLHACVQQTIVPTVVRNRVSLVSGSVTGYGRTNRLLRLPGMTPTGF